MKNHEKHRLSEFMRAAGDPPMRQPEIFFGGEDDCGYPVLDGGEFSAEFSGPMADRFAGHCRDLLRGAEIAKEEIERLREENENQKAQLAFASRQIEELKKQQIHPDYRNEKDPAIVDKNGEPLDVGDLFLRGREHDVKIVTELTPERSDYDVGYCSPSAIAAGPLVPTTRSTCCEKITSLTRSQYLPLAKRTLDPEMTRKERLSMLAFGLIGEWGELQKAIQEGDREKVLDECGDVLWYAEILCHEFDEEGDVYENVNLSEIRDWNRLSEQIKKEIFHGKPLGILWGMADDACASCYRYIVEHGGDIGKVRYQNIKKLIARYPDGFVEGGGER